MVSVMPFAGHVAPVTGMVAELLGRGHRVSVYTGTRYLARFERLGADVHPWTLAPDFDEHDLPATFPGIGRPGPVGMLANVEHLFIRSAEGQSLDLQAIYASEPWELLLGDVMSLGTGLAAEAIGQPWATLSIVPLSLPSVDLPPTGLGLHPGMGGIGALRDGFLRLLFRTMSGGLEKAHREVRASLGLPRPDRRIDSAWYSPWLVIATGSPGLEYPRSDLGPEFHFVGRLPSASAAGDGSALPGWWPELLASGRRTVLVTQGTFNIDPDELIRPTLESLAGERLSVVATTGSIAHDTLPFPVPTNVKVAGLLPFVELLPLVDVVVTNGGWGGVLEVLSHGIPLVVAGGDLDKPEIAARVAWAGAGMDLRTGRPRARAVGAAVREVLADPSYAERARSLAVEFANLGGTARAAELVERLIASGEPVVD
jgi:UDP:flavonoid glycosyltransferase YjiC (YdhE family)